MTEDLGKLILRLTVAILMLLHGVAKILAGVGGIYGMLQDIGLPGELAYGVYVGEVAAPLLVIIGLYARIAALVIALNMVAAVYLAHLEDIFALGRGGGWAIELQAFFLFTALAVALIGPGRFSVREN
ncbi:MAG TPA: DoxX family protein [Burkholderiales bacterium]